MSLIRKFCLSLCSDDYSFASISFLETRLCFDDLETFLENIRREQKFYSLPISDKNRFDVSRTKALRRELVWGGGGGGGGKHACFYTSEYIKTTRDKIKTKQMDLIKTRNINKNANHTIFYIQGYKNRRYVRKHARG